MRFVIIDAEKIGFLYAFFWGAAALEEGIPITDPTFYASEERCPDSLIEHVFRAAPLALEGIPLLRERIAIMREVGATLCAVSHISLLFSFFPNWSFYE